MNRSRSSSVLRLYGWTSRVNARIARSCPITRSDLLRFGATSELAIFANNVLDPSFRVADDRQSPEKEATLIRVCQQTNGFSNSRLRWESHALYQVLEARIRAQGIHPQIGLQKIRQVRRSLLVCFFEVFEGSVFVA